ncbi:putative receptor-like protein kinase At3g47110 [Prunus persica]|nr:putative receptor-like protein kinase At3g47110 [Prunus persica]
MGVLVLRLILIYSFFSTLVYCGSSLPGNETDRLALQAMKAQILQDPHRVLSSWKDSIHFCLWQGVNCSLQHHQRVIRLDLHSQNLVGTISPHIGNLSFLRELHLQNNSFSHEIPPEIWHLHRLQVLRLDNNSLSGSLPVNVSNCLSLINLNVGYNNLVGKISPEISTLSKLQSLVLQANHLTGEIPPSLGNLSSLMILGANDNNLKGSIPSSLGQLRNLTNISLASNTLSGSVPPSIYNLSALIAFSLSQNQIQGSILSDLGNTLPNLQYFHIYGNQFTGSIPMSISNATSLVELDISENKLTGQVPNLQNLVNLELLSMGNNNFKGHIPNDIAKLSSLRRLSLQNNVLSGSIPSSLGNLTMLTRLLLQGNNLEGSIPSSLGECQRLLLLNLSRNNLGGPIPQHVIGLPSLSISLDLSRNHFVGPFPLKVGQLMSLGALDISDNMLAGELPTSLGSCLSLEVLHLQGNLFKGPIPSSMISLKRIRDLDLSRNNLWGEIPQFLQGFSSLTNLNLSYNEFRGAVPVEGVFNTLSMTSIVGNNWLCGGIAELQLPKCKHSKESKGGGLSHRFILVISISGFLGIAMLLSLIFRRRLRKKKSMETEMTSLENSILQLSYSALLKATDGFSSINLIGVGSFGSVYKGLLLDDDRAQLVAVKVLNLLRRGASKSFIAECEALRNIRHRNLVKILTICSSVDFRGNDFKALVYEFMDNGSLEEWLHPTTPTEEVRDAPKNLNLAQRLDIAIDVACALDYLHNHCGTPIVHCDLKPSNVLLDDGLTGHVSDFGLARFLPKETSNVSANQISSTGIRGSVGYVAPEYGMGSKVTTYGDVYSFGILLLEMFTGKRPTDLMFSEGLNLHNFVKVPFPEGVTEIADPLLLQGDHTRRRTNDTQKKLKCLCLIFQIGIACSVESPRDRKDISHVASELQSFRDILLR